MPDIPVAPVEASRDLAWDQVVVHSLDNQADTVTCWPGMDVTKNHLQSAMGMCVNDLGETTEKRTLMVDAGAGNKVLIKSITITAFGLGGTPYVNSVVTFSEGNLSTDILTFVCGGTSNQIRWEGPYKTTKRKLWCNTVIGPDDDHPVNITIRYQIVKA